ncbi:MAG: EpsG family protein [Clostridia bacterium]|nr:EpsG family protein [Clostridia bacterium]
MIPYVLIIAIPMVIFLFYNQRVVHAGTPERQFYYFERRNKAILTCFFILLFGLLACRSTEIGVDLQGYLEKFNTIANTDFAVVQQIFDGTEPGFVLLTKGIAMIAREERLFIVVIAALCVAPFIPLYRKEAQGSLLVIALFMLMPSFTMMFSGIRQSLAMALVPLAFYCTKHRKLIFFILTVAVAMTFHSSAFILAMMYPVYHWRITRKGLYIVVPIMALIYIFNSQLYTLIVSLVGGKYLERYSGVADTGGYTMLILFILFAVYSFLVVDESKMDEENVGLRNLLLLSVCLQFMAPVNSIAMRLNYYYILLIPITISRVNMAQSPKYAQVVRVSKIVMTLFFFGYFIYKGIYGNDVMRIFPYVAFWE